MTTRRKMFIAALVIFITGLHYFSTMKNVPLHEFYRELFFVPAILAGLWGGKKSGLTTSIVISLLFLPHIVRTMGTTESTLLLNLFEIVLFNLAGGLAGVYGDVKQQYHVSLNMPYRPTAVQTEERQWLLFIDSTPASPLCRQLRFPPIEGPVWGNYYLALCFEKEGCGFFRVS
jgi:hypothetical protein